MNEASIGPGGVENTLRCEAILERRGRRERAPIAVIERAAQRYAELVRAGA